MIPGPAAIVYKTRANYDNLVPVTLSDDRHSIVAYAHPRDLVYADGRLRTPTPLRDGYLLDNRGITRNVAFLDMSYEDYARMSEAPSIAELNRHIIDRDPLVDYCNCGARVSFSDEIAELNVVIESGQLPKCKR
jgi:hypothetical protein